MPAPEPPAAPETDSQTVLLAVVGLSPAILTETVWALAHPSDHSPPVIPDEVLAITTLAGQRAISDQLLSPAPEFGGLTVWQALRQALLGNQATADARLTIRVAVIERPHPATGQVQQLPDIRDRYDNLAAAEFILRQVRQLADSPRRRLVASLAGGRKTMSALLHAAFTHLARPHDRLTHILVSEPFDSSTLTPRFFYPGQPAQVLTAPDGKTCNASEARLELADVPFAPMRIRFPDIADIPTRFRDLVQTYSETFKRDATQPAVIQLLQNPPRVIVDTISVELESERQLTVIRFLLEANQKQWLQKHQDEAAEIFKAWHGYQPDLTRVRHALRHTVTNLHHKRKARPGPDWTAKTTSDDIKRPLSLLRRQLERAGSAWLPPRRDLRLPPFRLASPA